MCVFFLAVTSLSLVIPNAQAAITIKWYPSGGGHYNDCWFTACSYLIMKVRGLQPKTTYVADGTGQLTFKTDRSGYYKGDLNDVYNCSVFSNTHVRILLGQVVV